MKLFASISPLVNHPVRQEIVDEIRKQDKWWPLSVEDNHFASIPAHRLVSSTGVHKPSLLSIVQGLANHFKVQSSPRYQPAKS